jgi:hypothetical protein
LPSRVKFRLPVAALGFPACLLGKHPPIGGFAPASLSFPTRGPCEQGHASQRLFPTPLLDWTWIDGLGRRRLAGLGA